MVVVFKVEAVIVPISVKELVGIPNSDDLFHFA